MYQQSSFIPQYEINPSGLGEAVAGVSTSEIRSWVQTMKIQEGGKAPDIHKVNGNMAWHKRSGSTKPIYQLYKSLGSSSKFLDYVKSKVPQEFGIKPMPSTTAVQPTTDQQPVSSQNANTGGGGSDTILGMQKKTVYLGGAGAAAAVVLYLYLT